MSVLKCIGMKVMDCMAMNDDIDIDTMTMLEAIRNLSKEELISMIIDVQKQRRIAQKGDFVNN